MTDPTPPPMNPGTDEADERQLALARRQGEAYMAAVRHMAGEVAQTGGTERVGDVVVGYAVEEAEGMYALVDGDLEWREPADENLHVEIVVMDAADHRFVPCLEVEVTLVDENGAEVGTHTQPMLWHPMLLHYGRNWKVPGDGSYTIRARIAPASFPRHDEVNGRRFAAPVEVEFSEVAVTTGQD